MGEGLDKAARSLLDLQPTAILDLFLVYPDRYNTPDIFYPIHNGSSFKKGVVWQGVNYLPISMEIDGFEVSADGRVNRPRLKISNKDYYVTNLLRNNEDFKNAKIVRKRTFVKFLDDKNFDGGNPFGEANPGAELSSQEYIVSQKAQENKIYVELELTSPLDLENFEINSRRIMGKYCYWQYRGMGCQYRGVPLQTENGENFTDADGNLLEYNGDFIYEDPKDRYDEGKNYQVGDLVFLENNRIKIQDPDQLSQSRSLLSYYIAKKDVKGLRPDLNSDYWEKDGCNKKLSSCKLRFTEESVTKKYVFDVVVATKTSNLKGHTDYHYWFEPKNSFSIKNTISGTKEWTIVMSYAELNENFNFAGFFQTSKDDRYAGINLFNKNRRDSLSFYVNGERKTIVLPKRKKKQVNYPIIIRKRNDTQSGEYYIELWAPTLETRKSRKRKFISPTIINASDAVISPSITEADINNVFEIGRSTWKKRGNQTEKLSSTVDLEAACVWGRFLNDEEIDYLFEQIKNGGKRLKLYKKIREDIVSGGSKLMKDLVAWWQEPFDKGNNDLGIYDYSQNGNTLIYKQDTPAEIQNFIKDGKYSYNVNKEVEVLEEISLLPFGGFPGTDGYSYQRSK